MRINLSEQTDMSDLMGSDLPIPDSSGDGQTLFRWSDGVLLSAIKNGDWVLLDELNLASQAVLEGLNSCLDYRASIFITEIGREFTCPPTFKVFAAQNPLTEGGGRKGLPKSFLNRFTKVHVSALESTDIYAIVRSKYPMLSEKLVTRMVDFNEKLNDSVNHRSEFGNLGSPWEFNLRDINRWCDLLTHNELTDELKSCANYARDIYMQRFRTVEDRAYVNNLYKKVFGCDILMGPLCFSLNDDFVKVGTTFVTRKQESGVTFLGHTSSRHEPAIFQSLLCPLEAVSRCIVMKWPCLLVGPSGSGKTCLVKGLAESCNQELEELALSPSSDVSDLIGTFEQVDSAEQDRDLLSSLFKIGSEYLVEDNSQRQVCCKIFSLMVMLKESLDKVSVNETNVLPLPVLKSAKKLAEALERESHNLSHFRTRHIDKINEVISRMDAPASNLHESGSHFRWTDGVLTRAMVQGTWLLLENVNLCPESVLDRLNPVLEHGGGLLLAECGSHRMIKAHPDFRIFLTMNPETGEISRAMRNRCVEIGLLPAESGVLCHGDDERSSESAMVDCLDVMWRSGLRLSTCTRALMDEYAAACRAKKTGHEAFNIKTIYGASGVASSLMTRGLSAESVVDMICRVFEVFRESVPGLLSSATDVTRQLPLVPSPAFRSCWLSDSELGQANWDSRPIRLFLGQERYLQYPLDLMSFLLQDFELPSKARKTNSNAILFRNIVSLLFLARRTRKDVTLRCDYLDGHDDPFADTFRFISQLFLETFTSPNDLKALLGPPPSHKNNNVDSWKAIQFLRLPQQIKEHVWKRRLQETQIKSFSMGKYPVLDVAYYIQTDQLDRSSVSCSITPLLLPFFYSIDKWVHRFSLEDVTSDINLVDSLQQLMLHRDSIWTFLLQSSFSYSEEFPVAFDGTTFLVLWQWFKKSLSRVESALGSNREANILIQEIDTILLGDGRIPPSIWSKAMHPLCPRKASQWKTLESMRKLSESCSDFSEVARFTNLDQDKYISLKDLVDFIHPTLFIRETYKRDLLLTMCMAHWSATDEVIGKRRQQPIPFSDTKAYDEIYNLWESQKKWFIHAEGQLRIDTTIETVENMNCISKLEQIESEKSNHDGQKLAHGLLLEFGRLQSSPIAESWCTKHEKGVVRALCRIIMESYQHHDSSFLKNVFSIVAEVDKFIQNALLFTTWPVSDLRPYQTLLWACESKAVIGENIKHLIQNLLPTMFYTLSKHTSDFHKHRGRFSDKMEMPALGGNEMDSTEMHTRAVPQQLLSLPMYTSCAQVDTVFFLIGSLFTNKRSSFCTIENHVARGQQSSDLIAILSTPNLHDNNQGPFELNYLLCDTLNALEKRFADESGKQLVSLIRDPAKLIGLDRGEARALASNCLHGTFQSFLDPVFVPLVDSLRRVWLGEARTSEMTRKDYSLLHIYIGLLRFLLLLPSSPIDPGRKPLAKKRLFESRINNLQVEVDAERLTAVLNGLLPNSAYAARALHEMESIREKMSLIEDRVVERAEDCPPFVELYRESQEFASNFTSCELVLSLVELVQKGGSTPGVGERINNWLHTSGSFCERLEVYYSCYMDIVLPLCDSLRIVRSGVLGLAADCLVPPLEIPNLHVPMILRHCLSYPLGISTDLLEQMNDSLKSLSVHSRKPLVTCQRALSFATLSRISLRKLLVGLDSHTVELSCTAFSMLVKNNQDIEVSGKDRKSVV